MPATKSFMNQMAVFYCLALRLAERLAARALPTADASPRRSSPRRRRGSTPCPTLIRETFDGTAAGVERAAQLLYLAPSMHILATRMTAVAKEGALKIREVVLNHTEGFEGSEFKHGPNTILGFNTVFGPAAGRGAARQTRARPEAPWCDTPWRGACRPSRCRGWCRRRPTRCSTRPRRPFALDAEAAGGLFDEVRRPRRRCSTRSTRTTRSSTSPAPTSGTSRSPSRRSTPTRSAARGPWSSPRSTRRCAQAAGKAPADNPAYQSVYIDLPRTNDTHRGHVLGHRGAAAAGAEDERAQGALPRPRSASRTTASTPTCPRT